MTTAPYRIHRLIQDVAASVEATRAFNADPQSFFERYGLTEEEKRRLAVGAREDMLVLGVHPNLQMKYSKIRAPAPPPGARPPLADYLDRLKD
jgi:hypothetical protein